MHSIPLSGLIALPMNSVPLASSSSGITLVRFESRAPLAPPRVLAWYSKLTWQKRRNSRVCVSGKAYFQSAKSLTHPTHTLSGRGRAGSSMWAVLSYNKTHYA
jgi:hypothetical protein